MPVSPTSSLLNSKPLTTPPVFLECRTSNRNYHSLPCYQIHELTKKNLPDAPRLKAQRTLTNITHVLSSLTLSLCKVKACLLPQEKLGSAEKLRTIADLAVGYLSTSGVKIMTDLFMAIGAENTQTFHNGRQPYIQSCV